MIRKRMKLSIGFMSIEINKSLNLFFDLLDTHFYGSKSRPGTAWHVFEITEIVFNKSGN